MLTTREQIIAAGLAVEITDQRELVRRVAESPLEASARLYLLQFSRNEVQLVQSGVFVALIKATRTRRSPPGPQIPDPLYNATPLVHVQWDGEKTDARYPSHAIGLIHSTDAGRLIVASLSEILWVEKRPHKQQDAHRLAPPVQVH